MNLNHHASFLWVGAHPFFFFTRYCLIWAFRPSAPLTIERGPRCGNLGPRPTLGLVPILALPQLFFSAAVRLRVTMRSDFQKRPLPNQKRDPISARYAKSGKRSSLEGPWQTRLWKEWQPNTLLIYADFIESSALSSSQSTSHSNESWQDSWVQLPGKRPNTSRQSP